MQHMADLHDRFRRRVVYRFGAWTAEMLEDFDVTTLMKEVTLDGPDAEQAFHNYMGQVGGILIYLPQCECCCLPLLLL